MGCRTSPSSGQATINSLLRLLKLPACHSRAALGIRTPVWPCSGELYSCLHTFTVERKALCGCTTYGFVDPCLAHVLLEEIADQFEAAKQQLITASAKWQLVEQLFAKSQGRSDFLRRTGSGFFALVRDSVVTDVMISLGRLLEKPHLKGNDNLTLERLMTSVSELGTEELVPKLAYHLQNAKAAYEATRLYRNKRLAHNDLKTILEQEAMPLPPATVGEIRTTLREAGEFLNIIDLHYRRSTTTFGYVMIEGDADGIVGLIRDGLRLREGNLNRKRSEAGLEPVDWSIPDDA